MGRNGEEYRHQITDGQGRQERAGHESYILSDKKTQRVKNLYLSACNHEIIQSKMTRINEAMVAAIITGTFV